MAQDKKTADVFEKHFPGETPGEVLKRMQQQLEFMLNLPTQLLAYQSKPSSRKIHQEQPLGQENTSGLFFSYLKPTAVQSTPKLEQAPVLEVRNKLVGQATAFGKIGHLAPARRLTVNKKP
jgi:hypothetical protein